MSEAQAAAEEGGTCLEKPHTPPGVYISIEELVDILSGTIKHDRDNKLILFLTTLLNYTSEDQQNTGFSGPSSAGKSYLALEVSKFFPPEDVEILGYCSPTSFYHNYGVMKRADGTPLESRSEYVEKKLKNWEDFNRRPDSGNGLTEWKENRRLAIRQYKDEWDELDKIYEVNLERKILVFTDQPHDILLQHLRSLLSHDRKRIQHNITDRSKDGGNRTKKIVTVGFPTVIFCSTQFSLDEQERTRMWLVSPDMDQSKLEKSIDLLVTKLSNRGAFTEKLLADQRRHNLKMRINTLKQALINQVILNENEREYIRQRFFDEHHTLKPRHQRDLPRLVALIKAFTLLNFMHREKTEGGDLVATHEDVENGYDLYDRVATANELGLPPEIYNLWNNSLKPRLEDGGFLTRRDVSGLYYEY